nr:MAG TPA: hypothetical protein [Caudoviricetes sp.]
MASNDYYDVVGFPSGMITDTAVTFKLRILDTTTGLTYSVKYEFICDGTTTSGTLATGLTDTTYTYTPSTAKFAPLMAKSEEGTIRMFFETNNSHKNTVILTMPLKLKASIKPSRSNSVTSKTNYFNSRSISNITTHKYTFKVAGLYGASQTVEVTIGSSKYTKEVAAVSDNTSTSVSFDIGALEATGSSDYDRKTINIKITDSRGRTYTSSDYIDIYKYSPPDVVASIARNKDEQPVLTFIPTYQATVAGAANALTIFWARCNVDGEVYETDLKGKTSPQVLVGTYDLAKAYQFTIAIKDSVRPSAIIKRVILPSAIPVMDIGADGKTVTFFGTSPSSADKNTLRIGDVASFGEEIILGNNSNLIINKSNIEFNKDNKKQLLFGEDDIVIPNTIGEIRYRGKGATIKSPTKNIVVSTLQTKDESNTSKGGKSALELYYDSENDIVGFALSAKKGTSYTDLYESEGRGLFMEYGTYDSANEADVSLSGDNTTIYGTNTFMSGDEYVRIESNNKIHCQAPGLDVKLGKNTILWDANTVGYWMIASHKFTLNAPISKQLNGAVFVWSHYSNGACDNWWWTSFFVPKQHVAWRPGDGMLMSNPYYGLNKYIYIGDTFIQGADVNKSNAAQNGIAVNNQGFVLRYVLGV